MKKIFLLAVVAATVCVTMIGCGKNNSKPQVEKVETESSIEETQASNSEEYKMPTAESVAKEYGVKLADNQSIVTGKEGEAVVITALEGFKFANRYRENNVALEKEDHSAIYYIFDCTGNLTEESLKENYEVMAMGDGCYYSTQDGLKIFCFKDNAVIVVSCVEINDDEIVNIENVDVENVTANIKALAEDFVVISK